MTAPAAHEMSQQEIESLQEYLRDKRTTQQRFQDEADRQAVDIQVLEVELDHMQHGDSA